MCVRPVTVPVAPRSRVGVGGVLPPLNRQLVACGRCIECVTSYRRAWAVRGLHELASHVEASLLTLTIDDAHLLDTGFGYSTVDPAQFSAFIRSLRKRTKRKLRYIVAGEYGDKFGRPHYHAVIYGWRPVDVKPSMDGPPQSSFLSEVWPFGQHHIGEVTAESVAYCVGYCTKKLNDSTSRQSYIDRAQHPPFIRVSTRPGIGHDYALKYADDARLGFFRDTSGIYGIPRYYRKLYEVHRFDIFHTLNLLSQDYIDSSTCDIRSSVSQLSNRSEIGYSRLSQLSSSL